MSDTNRAVGGRGVLLIHREQCTPPPHSRRPSRTRKPRESRQAKKNRLARIKNEPVPRLFLNSPPRRSPSLFKPKGYTGCLEGYQYSSDRRRKTIMRNNRMLGRRFTHLVNINLEEPRHPALINRDFRAFIKELKKLSLNGHWTIEINRLNTVHWHLLFLNYEGTEHHLKRTICRCLDAVPTFPSRRVYAKRIRNQRQTIDYVLKVKKSGYGDVFNPLVKTTGRRIYACPDIYAKDRILFKPNTGLDKHGTFGNFWAKGFNEQKVWAIIREETATVARNYSNPRIRTLVHGIHEKLGIPLARVKWAYCLNPPKDLLEPSPSPPRKNARISTRPPQRSRGLVGLVFLKKPVRVLSIKSAPEHWVSTMVGRHGRAILSNVQASLATLIEGIREGAGDPGLAGKRAQRPQETTQPSP